MFPAGYVLLEVLVGLAILAVAFLGTVDGMFFSIRMNHTNRESSRATQMCRGVVEQVRSFPLDQVYAEFNADPADDPGGPGTGQGNLFSAEQVSLKKASEGDEGMLAEVSFPIATDGTLREDSILPEFGLPMDLNGDGSVAGGDRSTDYLVLPLAVRVRWNGANGERSLEFFTILRR